MPTPPTFDPTEYTLATGRVTLREYTADEAPLQAAILEAVETANSAENDTAAVSPIGPTGQPRIMQLSGWLTFAEEVSRNGRAFTRTDLEAAVAAGLFQAPHFGMLDYNHDFNLYGVWYAAKFAFDDVSQRWGVFAEGVLFAWRFPDLADKMLAMQQRQGHIDLSAAWLTKWYEPATDGGDYEWARQPTFFATSVLDVDPAYPNARAIGSEDPRVSTEQRVADLQLVALACTAAAQRLTGTAPARTPVEDQMAKSTTPAPAAEIETASTAETVETPETVSTETAEPVAEPVVETDTPSEPGAEVEVDELPATDAEIVEPTDETVTEPETASTEPEEPVVIEPEADTAAVAALTSEVGTLRLALDAAKRVIDEQATELETLRAFKTDADTKVAADAAKAQRTARMAQLPEHVRQTVCDAAGAVKPDHQELVDAWMTADPAVWDRTLATFAVAAGPARKTLAERSAEEGPLAGVSDRAEGEYRITRWLTPKRK